MDSTDLLRKLAYEGLEEIGFSHDDKYIQRLERELSIVSKLNFTTYFLVMWDIARYARDTGILAGPGRGSGAGSLLNYCLHITLIDPIKYNLIFERFLNPDRVSPPDIDWDCADRDRVIQYIEERYGSDKVCKVGSLNFLRTKSAIRDVGRVLDKPRELIEELVNLVPPPIAGLWDSFEHECEVSPKLRDEKYADIISVVEKLWSITRSFGTHASGIAISPTELTDFVPLHRGSDNKAVSQFDWRDLEKAGLLKFDILGLSTLQVIQLCLDYLKQDGININLYKLEDGDPSTYDLIQRGDLDGIFQLGGSESIKQLTISIAPQSIEDLSLISALFRPGPLASGMVSQVISARQKKEKVQYISPLLEPILETTYGAVVFQEQAMRIANELARFSLAESDSLRKIIGKKLKDKMEDMGKKLVLGMENNNIPRNIAQEIFGMIEGSASYSFNLAHSVAYAVISYWTGYLKAHHPIHFYTALLSFENDSDKVIQYINSAKESGINILPPDINASAVKHKPEGGNIRFGLGHIKGMPLAIAEEIVRTRDSIRS